MKLILFVSLLAVLSACAPQIRVYSDYDPDYDLWTYKTFDWGQKIDIEKGKNPLHYNELNDKRIKSAVEQQMNLRGYVLTAENPDLIAHYHIIVADQSVLATEPYGYQYSSYWTQAQVNVYAYREGTLIIDLMDRKTNNLIWRGWAVSVIDKVDPEKVEDLIKESVTKIFGTFPKSHEKKTQNAREAAAN